MAFAVIAAGGSGDRLGVGQAKFEAEILGRPMVYYSLEVFQSSSAIDAIILVVPAGRMADWSPQSLHESGISKASLTVAGGATRQESVFLGLQLIEGEAGVVAVHDAARPSDKWYGRRRMRRTRRPGRPDHRGACDRHDQIRRRLSCHIDS